MLLYGINIGLLWEQLSEFVIQSFNLKSAFSVSLRIKKIINEKNILFYMSTGILPRMHH